MIVLFLTAAMAADVLWLDSPPDDQRAAVLTAAAGRELTEFELRGAATRFSPADEASLTGLASAVSEVRAYESQLDGELVIMRDLQPAIEAVGVLRNESDRNALFAALAYQGFAVDRFFGDDLAANVDASSYRIDFNGVIVELPWIDAAALEPSRDVTAYDIAEAPQRIAYAGVKAISAEVLPASIRPPESGGELYVDGRQVDVGPTGDIKVPPGRHLVHLEQGDVITARWDLRLTPGGQQQLELAFDDGDWADFLGTLEVRGSVPDGLSDAIAAHGGEVWLARTGSKAPQVFAVSSEGVRSVPIEMSGGGQRNTSADKPFSITAAALGGWTGSPDFYYQDPRLPAEGSTVNAISAGASVGAELGLGPLQVGVGADLILPLGADHVAKTGASQMRLRTVPHVAVGIQPAALAVGYVLPYHPAVGLRGAIPLVGPLELRWMGWFGLPSTRQRDAGGDYAVHSLGMAAGGLGARL